jgi:hypothetical protein
LWIRVKFTHTFFAAAAAASAAAAAAAATTQVFQAVGPVIELVVVRDKFTHESKGSAFVWYSTRADADQVGRCYMTHFARHCHSPNRMYNLQLLYYLAFV